MKSTSVFRLTLTLLLSCSLAANANPLGGAVTAGSATINHTGPGSLTINQTSGRTIINWNSFSIGAGEVTRFVQPNSSSIALNRVTGGSVSQIYGTLQANGRVYVINPSGILIGPSGTINTHTFVGSTLDINDASFLAGVSMRFAGSSTASVKNQGTINALGGDVFLFGHTVENAGSINAANGTVGMGAGSEVLLKQSGNDRFAVLAGNINAPPTAVGVNNAGAVQAASAELKAAGGNIYALAINNGGIVRADTIVNQGGRILLRASGGNIQNSGTLDASGKNGGSVTVDGGHSADSASTVISSGTISAKGTDGKGGQVKIVGDHVGLVDHAVVDVSGNTGGGTALVGGDMHGGNAAVQNAEATYVGAEATINADAGERGDGGKVVVWSDQVTRFYGQISARGGALSGNGGSVEVSGKQSLYYFGNVDLRAPNGSFGTLLLDPDTITIIDAADTGGTLDGQLTPGTDNHILFGDANAGANTLSRGQLEAFGVSADVIIEARDGVTMNSLVGHTLDLAANSGGSLTINADGDNDGTGNFTMDTADTILTHGGAVTITGVGITVGTIQTGGVNDSVGGAVTLTTHGGGAISAVSIDTSAGGRTGNNNGLAGGTVNLTTAGGSSGSITVSSGIKTTGGTAGGTPTQDNNGGTAGDISLSASGNINVNGATLVANGGVENADGNGGNAGSVTLSGANVQAGIITANGRVPAGAGNNGLAGQASITGSGTVTLNNNITVAGRVGTPGTDGAISLNASGGSLTQPGGALTGNRLILTGSGPITLNQTANDVNNLVANTTADISYRDANDLTLGAPAGTLQRVVSGNHNIDIRTVNGTMTVASGASGADVNAGSGSVNLVAGGDNQLLIVNDIINGTGGVTLTADRMGINNDITAAGATVQLGTFSSGRAITLGTDDVNASTATTGTLGLTDAELDHVGPASVLHIGSATGGAIQITDNISIGATVPVLSLQSGTGFGIGQDAGKTITTAGTLALRSGTTIALNENNSAGTLAATAPGTVSYKNDVALAIGSGDGVNGVSGSAVTVTTTGDALALNNNIQTTGGNVDLSGVSAINVGANVTIDTDAAGGATAAGNVTVGAAAINGNGAGRTLKIDATADGGGTAGTVTLAAVGQSTALGSLDASGSTVTVGAVRTSGDQSYTGDAITLNGNLQTTSSGALTLQPLSVGTSIGIGDTAAGTLLFDNTALGRIQNGFSSITFGRADGQHAIDIRAVTFTDPVVFRAPVAPGSITVNGQITGNGDASVTLMGSGATTTLNANIVTSGNAINILDSVILGTPSLITLDTTSGAAAGANIHISGPVNDDASGATGLTLLAGTSGLINLDSAVGTILAIGALTASGSELVLGGNIRTDHGTVDFTGLSKFTIANNVSITTDQTFTFLPAGSILFGSGTKINGTTAGLTLTLDASGISLGPPFFFADPSGNVTLGQVGDVTPLGGLTVRGATLTLNGDVQVNGGGAVDFSGVSAIKLANSVTIDTDTAGGATAAGNINLGFAGIDGTAAGRTLVLDATSDNGAAGAITVGPVGQSAVAGDFPLATFTASGASITANAVKTTGDQSFTADNMALNGDLQSLSGGILTLQALNSGTTVGIGTGASGTLSLDDTEIAHIKDGFSAINIGRTGGGAIDITSASFTDTVNFRSGGALTLHGNLQNDTGGGFSFANVGSVHLASSATIDTDAIDIGPATLNNAGAVTFGTTAVVADSPGLSLTINTTSDSGLAASVTLGAVGTALTPLNTLSVSGNNLNLNGAVNAGTVLLTSSGSVNGLGQITATSLGISVASGIGTLLNPLQTSVQNLEASADTGGIFINNDGNLSIGNVSGSLSGVRVNTAGDIVLNNNGSISILTGGEIIKGPGNVTVNANGALADLSTGGFNNGGSGSGAITALSGLVTVHADHDLLMGGDGTVGYGDIVGQNVVLTAGRNINLAGASFADATGVAGTLTATATGDILLQSGRFSTIGGDLNLNGVNLSLGSTVTATSLGTVNLNNSGLLSTPSSGLITAGTINLAGAGAVGSVGSRVHTAASEIVYDKAGIDTFVDDSLAVNIQGSAALIDLSAQNAVSQSGIINASTLRVKTLNDGGAAITLDTFNNNVSTVNLQARNSTDTGDTAGAIAFKGAAAVAIEALETADNATITAGGNITQSGAINVNGVGKTASFNVTAANSDILVGSFGNDIRMGSFGVSGAGSIHNLAFRTVNGAPSLSVGGPIGNDATLTFNGGGISLPTMSVGGNLIVSANGAISQSGALTVNTVGKSASFTATGQPITLGLGNDFATASFTAGSVTVNDINGLILGASTVSGNLGVTAGGAITQSGALQAGTASFTAAGQPITLGLGNDFGTASFTGSDVTLNDINGLILGTSSASGTATITAGGPIAQSGTLSLNTASFTASGQAITLGLGNDFGTAGFTGGDVTVNDINALVLGGSTISGNLIVTAGGPITQSGAIIANGPGKTASFTAAGQSITLGGANNFATASFTGSDVSVRDINGLILGNVRATGIFDIRTDPSAADVTQVLGTTVEVGTLTGNLGGGLVLGNPSVPTTSVPNPLQPANKFNTIGDLSHNGLLYIYDSDTAPYAGQFAEFGLAGNNLGLVINGTVSGSGNTIIRTAGDLVLNTSSHIESSGSGSDIELSAENNRNFHNLAGANAVAPGSGSRFLIFSTTADQNYKFTFAGGQFKFNGLSTVGPSGQGFISDSPAPTFLFHLSNPLVAQNNQVDNGSQNGFVFLQSQTFKQNNQTAKFFLDLLGLTVFSGVDAAARADNLPPERPPTIWTSTYHLYLQEKEREDEKKKKKKKAVVEQVAPQAASLTAGLGGE